jgi:Leucine-rich repeat (LRR) protein
MKLYQNLNVALKDAREVKALKLKINARFLPPDLFELSKLQFLYLEGNFEQLPEEIFKLRDLKELSLKSPNFKGNLAIAFKLPSLVNFKVFDTPLRHLDLPLGHSTSALTSLTLKNTRLESLPEEIFQLYSLKEMNLSGNQLSSLPFGFGQLKNLRRLNLDLNQFYKFPNLITSLPSLHHLSIDDNPFSDEEKARIQRVFHLHL